MTRLREFDFIRVVAALSIVIIHITASYISINRYAYYLNQFVRYAVPIFVLISGVLLSTSLRGKEVKYIDFIRRRMKKVCVPYLVWTIAYILFNNRSNINTLIQQDSGFGLYFLKHLLHGSASGHLYFIIIIIQLYLLFPLLKSLADRAPKVSLVVCFAVTLLFQTAIYLSLLHKITLPNFIIPYYIFFPTWIFYFLFGMYFAASIEAFKRSILDQRILVTSVWILSFIILLVDSRTTGTYVSSIKPSIIFYCMTTFFFLYFIFANFRCNNQLIEKVIEWISVQSFIIYLSHPILITITLILTKKAGMTSIWSGTPGMLMLLIFITAASLAFSYLVSLTPFAGLLGGVAKSNNKVAGFTLKA